MQRKFKQLAQPLTSLTPPPTEEQQDSVQRQPTNTPPILTEKPSDHDELITPSVYLLSATQGYAVIRGRAQKIRTPKEESAHV